MEQKPSVGRIVHYGHAVYDKSRQYSPVFVEPWAAIITQVNESDIISLTVFPPSGTPYPQSRVRFSIESKADHWSWPPRV